MNKLRAELLTKIEGISLGEGPCWDPRSSSFLFVDIMDSSIFELADDGSVLNRFRTPSHVGAVLPAKSDDWLIVLQDGFYVLSRSGDVAPLLQIEHGSSIRFNDAKCDANGRAFAGTMSYTFDRGAGSLYRLDPPLVASKILTDLTISNGIGWSPDNKTMYFIDSATQCVVAMPYDIDSGSIGTGRELVRFTDREGMPDGLCVDADGGVWVALLMGSEIRRITPRGEADISIELPVRRPTSCAFGGQRGNQLLITTSSFAIDECEREEAPLSGALFSIELNVTAPPASLWDLSAVATTVENEKL